MRFGLGLLTAESRQSPFLNLSWPGPSVPPFRGSYIYCKEHAAVQGLQGVYRGLTVTKRKELETCMAGRTLEF